MNYIEKLTKVILQHNSDHQNKKEDGEVILAHRGEVRKGSVPGQAIVKKFTTIRVNKILPSAITALENAKRYSF